MEYDPSRRVDGKPRSVIKILLIVLAVCSLVAILACGGIGFLFYRFLRRLPSPRLRKTLRKRTSTSAPDWCTTGRLHNLGGMRHRLQGLWSSSISPAAFASRPG